MATLTDEYVPMETEGCYEKSRETFSNNAVFASHLCNDLTSENTVNGQLVRYKCPLCDEVFPMPGAMKLHFRIHENEPKGPFNCTEQGCQFSTPDRQIYQDHLSTEHAFSLIPCTFRSCSLAFCSRGEMEQHWRNHMPFHCPDCQFATSHAKTLSAHCLEHGQRGKKAQPATTGLDGGSQSSPETGSSRPRRACKPNPAYKSSSQEEGDEEEAERKRLKKRAAKQMQKDKSFAVTSNNKLPSKGRIMEGTEHMYHTHICPECHRCFKMRSHLLEHLHLHFPDPGLQCPTCKHFFTSKSKLRVHMLREAGQKVHRCHLCEYAAVERNSLRRHLVSVHDEEGADSCAEVYPCPTCGQSFRQSRALKSHMKSHRTSQDGKPLTCFQEGCPFQSSDKKQLLKHAADVHGIEAVECRHHACNAVFGSRKDMEAHRRTHLAFHCSQCDYSCSNKTLFQQHKRQGHAGDEELSCDFCPFTSFNPVEFHQHVGHFHANEKIHRCPQCSFVTAHKRVLGRHMLMHSGEKPHKCKLCDFRCRDETYLSKHMLTHSDDKNHMCSECGYVTKWKHYLNVHMRKHAGDLRYQCDQCSYRCHRTDQLNSHKLRHQAKSLICEVCAYSCKRKYELRRHMLLKHSQGEGHKPPTFQCKYCPYHTCYRQALLNHENCKHTRTREFRCALCPYSTYSGTSLFLHKRKIHGYVPGDKEWLEKYATKERENDAIDFLQDFFRAPVATQDLAKKCAEEGPVESLREQAHVTDSVVQSRCNRETLPGLETLEMENNIVAQEMVDQGISVDDSSANDPEQCCTLVLTAISNTECIETTFLESVTDTSRDLTHQKPKIDSQGSESPKPLAPSGNDAEDEDVMEDCEDDLSDLDDNDTPLASKCQQEEAADEAAKETHTTETTEACLVSSGPSEPSSQNDSTETEVRLKAMRKHDRDQAEALVLEGRVQMLVVRKRENETVYRCDHCSYVSCKQNSLKHHCRSACQARWKGLKCQACGAQFKQKRGLDTHCLRKCPARQKTKRVVRKPSANLPAGEESGCGENGFNQPDQITTSDTSEIPAGENEMTRRLVDVLSVDALPEQRVEEGNACDSANPSAEKAPNSGRRNIQRRKSEKTKGNTKVWMVKKGNIFKKDKASSAKSEMNNTHGYTTVDGKFTCKLCSFTSSRLATVERHCSRCRGKTPSKKPAGSSRDLEVEDGNEELQVGEEVEEDSDFGEAVEKVSKSSHRFSCPSCPFMCHQKRALDTHEKRGCLKPDEVQCQLCSFVAKSQKALTNHVLVHQRDKPSSSKLYKKDILHCEQCPFICKQERCMTQHVSLKHDGARPHRCSFCPFSTTRRYRLEAHKSLHTGLGRHICHACNRTFGTSSKLQQHRRRVHDKRPSHFCSLCDFSGYSLSDIGRHTLSCHTGELKHTCSQCQSCFSSEAALKQHCNRQHSSFSCPHCSFTCCSQATLKTHQQSKHPQLECTLCQEAFHTQESLETHRRTHLTQQCPLCTFATRRRQLLAQHLLDEHERGPPEANPLKCALCGFTCSHQLVLEQHARSHGATHFYKCADCQYSTRNKQKITWHSRIHTGEKPYHCEQCSYTCADPSRLKYHMRIHQEEKKYLCPECGYKCKWMSQLKYHMTKHTGDKPYACDECEYRTNRGDSLRIHQDTQHRDTRSYICEKCGKGFKTRFLLKTHQRKHSEEKPYACGRCEKSFRWPAGLRHHYLTHSNQQAFLCRHCPYRAKHRFQVVKHLRRHHPQLPVEQGVAKDPSFPGLSLQEARLGALEEVGEEERQEGAQGEAEAEAHGRTENDTQMEADSVTLEVKVVQTKKTYASK